MSSLLRHSPRPLFAGALVFLLAASGLGRALYAADLVRYDLRVELDPPNHGLRVTAEITLSAETAGKAPDFALNRGLTLERASLPVVTYPAGSDSPVELPAASQGVELTHYWFEPHDAKVLTLVYQGTFHHGLSPQEEEYSRGFRETGGMVSPEGVYLAGGGFWYPVFDSELVTFRLDVNTPPGWHLISQGKGTSRTEDGRARWESAAPMEEIFLVGGPLTRFHDTGSGGVQALVYLHENDEGLASKYLTTTFQYLEMYRQLIGPYPYSKFALVENFWETGYGMPSFTLLGPTVIRFPFILHSSYPHEILHNWWGNSVFVDADTGNWCEGLTAYLADHLIQEQRGTGAEYRRSTLQRYRNYVQEGEDFPLDQFRSRHNAASAAVGYGKALMGFHALRRRVGDQVFRTALARFYAELRGRRASFQDLRRVLEAVSGEDLAKFFDDWTGRTGAPVLAVEGVTTQAVSGSDPGFVVGGRVKQVQEGEPFSLRIPLAVVTASGTVQTEVALDQANGSFSVTTRDRPLRLAVDPEFDLFRRLDPRETPAAINQIFGEPEILAVLPSRAGAEEIRRYRDLISSWQSEHHKIEAALDSELEALNAVPKRSLWILGRENSLASEFQGLLAPGELGVGSEQLTLQGEAVPLARHSTVVLARHPANLEKAVGWIVVDPPQAFAGMARKLPHYGKYSYLAFEGDEPVNVVKGQWAATDSPLQIDLRPPVGKGKAQAPLALARRLPLAELPPAFSQRRLMDHASVLASPELKGRGLGSPEIEQAAAYIAGRFEEYGLVGGGPDSSYLQSFKVTVPPGFPDSSSQPEARRKTVGASNVIAYLPATDPRWQDQSVLLTAHYDHLGLGWPDVHEGDQGKVHPGADDNSSGVAVLLELAKSFAADSPPRRNLVFVAFTGEEAGRLGSRHFADNPTPFPLEGIMGVVNLDSVGRLFDGQLQVIGTGSAGEWPHIFRGSTYVTGVPSKMVPGPLAGSDHTSFLERKIPAVQIFSGPHADYHRPTDTVEKLDASGLVRVAGFVKEAVAYLTEREEPLTSTLGGTSGGAGAPAPPAGGRRVSFGSLPDFAYPGPGVRCEDIQADSPAARAGLKPGDVLIRINDVEIEDLRHFSSVLRSLSPGDQVRVRVRRGKETVDAEVEVEVR